MLKKLFLSFLLLGLCTQIFAGVVYTGSGYSESKSNPCAIAKKIALADAINKLRRAGYSQYEILDEGKVSRYSSSLGRKVCFYAIDLLPSF